MAPAHGRATVRTTAQRQAVTALLAQLDEFRTAQEIHALLRERGDSIGLTTVYRSLQLLAETGELDVLRTEDGDLAYRRCGAAHHHHLVCRVCARTVEVDGPAAETWAVQVAQAHGFTEVTHTIEIYGVCSACADARARDAR